MAPDIEPKRTTPAWLGQTAETAVQFPSAKSGDQNVLKSIQGGSARAKPSVSIFERPLANPIFPASCETLLPDPGSK
jgi:hypothetical protein